METKNCVKKMAHMLDTNSIVWNGLIDNSIHGWADYA